MVTTEFARTNQLTIQNTGRGRTTQHDGHVDFPHPVRLNPILLLVTVSCSAGSAGQAVSVAPAQPCVTGTVFRVGTDFDPATILRMDDGEQIRITGEREEQIRWLSGTVLTVCGERATDARAENVVEAESFELRAVDGMTAYLGTLNHTDGRWELTPNSGSAPVPLSGVSDQLRAAQGSLVWVAGGWADQAFSVKSFGLMGRS